MTTHAHTCARTHLHTNTWFARPLVEMMEGSQLLLVHAEVDLGAVDCEQALAPGELTKVLAKVLQTL
jgi:hypothetical protein